MAHFLVVTRPAGIYSMFDNMVKVSASEGYKSIFFLSAHKACLVDISVASGADVVAIDEVCLRV